MLNRAAIILKPKAPFVDWINSSDPSIGNEISIDETNEERTVFLVPEEAVDDPVNLLHWLKLNWQSLFESELDGWYTDESMWPQDRTFELFQEWVEVECHSCITDTVGEPIYDDELVDVPFVLG